MSPWILVYIFGGLVQRLWPWPHIGGFRHTTLPEQVQNHEQPSIGAGAGSSPVSRNLAQYDVFLNHRGCDVKRTFVSHLDAALRRVGCNPFLDAKSLVKGDHALNSINDALTGVQVHVAVFSPKYAESEYCLIELFDILASGKPLIPVFYNVDPEDVQCPENEKGRFAEAFKMWRGMKGRDQDVERWKGALMKAGDITGFTSATYTNEMKLVNEVVDAVLKALPPVPPVSPARHPVGLKENSMGVINMLHNMGDDVGVLGIYGMGGIGKTTLAMEVYNQEQSRFDNWCFLKDVKGTSIMDLQKKMVVNMLGRDAEKMVENYARCLQAIYKKKVLIVVDDVSGCKQFEELILDLNQLTTGSRIIVTSRESDISNNIARGYPHVKHELYHVLELNNSDSLELFMGHAFKKKSLDAVEECFHDKVINVVKACGGVPLALEVIGGYLASKKNQPGCWEEAVERLRRDGNIYTRLKISYDGLNNDDEKNMFEDIACVLLGHSKDIAMEAWKSTRFHIPVSSFYALIDKCLVKLDAEGIIVIHDLLRDMGRKIVMDRAKGKLEMLTHIWDPSVATKALRRACDSYEIVALSLLETGSSLMENKASSSIIENKAEAYARMKDLRYLFLDKCLVNGDFSGWSDELKWLQWRSFPHQELPTSLKIQNLAVLDLANSHSLTHVWARNSEIAQFFVAELRMLILNNCSNLVELPQDIIRFKKLKLLNLNGCTSLTSLPDSLGDLTKLEKLELSQCTGLRNLPPLSGLKKLKVLHMPDTAFKELPEDFGMLTSLENAHFGGCKSLVRLPDSIGKLSNLEVLHIGECELLEELPSSFCKLGKLRTLSAYNTALKELPEDFGLLRSLKNANFAWCNSLVRLPDSFGMSSNLEELHIGGCELLEELPSSCCMLGKLKTLTANYTALKELPDNLGLLTSLKNADFFGCKSLVRLPDSIGKLSNLEVLQIGQCELLEELPSSFCKLGKLKTLSAYYTALKELPEDFGLLRNMENAHFTGCKSLVRLPESFGMLSNLEVLHIGKCELLQELPSSFCKLGELKTLIANYTALKELPEDFGLLTSLKNVDFGGCKNLVRLPDSFRNLSNFEVLHIGECELLEELSSFICKLGKLKTLSAYNTAMKELPEDFGLLTSLKSADFEGCKSLVRLPDSFGMLSNLEVLHIGGCELLEELPSSICMLGKLETLSAYNTALKELPEDFGLLKSLENADFEGCKSLVRLPDSFGKLSNLEGLNIRECELLEELPSSIRKLEKLKTLNIKVRDPINSPRVNGYQYRYMMRNYADFEGCKSLVRLPDSFGMLSNWEILNISKCELLDELPSSICKLRELETLIAYNTALKELPEDFGLLKSLENADFEGCKSLVRLPDSFGMLSNLEVLHIGECELLQELPSSFCKLGELKTLIAYNTELKELPEDFGLLTNLRIADFAGCKSLVRLPESFGMLSNLEVLHIEKCVLLEELPSSFCKLGKLRTLSAYNTVLKELPEDFGLLTSLKNVDFLGCKSLVRLPDSFGKLSNLEGLNIRECELLEELPSSFCKLEKLKSLRIVFSRKSFNFIHGYHYEHYQYSLASYADFAGCKSLVRLPDSFGKLSNLEVLILRDCVLLEELPSSICMLGKLKTLSAYNTALKELPEDFGLLTSLKNADFAGCKSLVRLPDSFGKLSNLEELHIGGCELLEEFRSSCCQLGKLRTLSAYNTALKELPDDLGLLTSLKNADFERSKNLVQLPDSIGKLSNLEVLHIGECELLQELPSSFCKLGKLRTLSAYNTALKELPEDFGLLRSLKNADFAGCKSLVRLPDSFGMLSNLEELHIGRCKVLEELPSSFCKLGKLRTLSANFTEPLKELPEDFGLLRSLKNADFLGCKSLVRLPDSFGKLSNLEGLNIGECELLEELPSSFCKLGKLRTLSAYNTVLKELPADFGLLTNLDYADFEGCKSLVRLPDSFGMLSNLEVVKIRDCVLVEELPSSSCMLGKLKTLSAYNTAMKELPEDFGLLTSLKSADFEGCKSLVRLPDSFGMLSNLEVLHLGDCELLEELPSSICKLGKLRTLSAYNTALKELPEDFGLLRSLKNADFAGCKSLVRLPDSFGELFDLEVLHIGGCELLEELPSSFCKLRKLRTLSTYNTALKDFLQDFGQLTNLDYADFRGVQEFGSIARFILEVIRLWRNWRLRMRAR